MDQFKPHNDSIAVIYSS